MDFIKKGTQLKLNIHIEPISGFSMFDYNFYCDFYTNGGTSRLNIKKDNLVYEDDNNYIALIDTGKLIPGRLFMRVTAYIPDTYVPAGHRIEKAEIDTGIFIQA